MTNFYRVIHYCFLSATIATLAYLIYLFLPIEKNSAYFTSDPQFLILSGFLVVVFGVAAVMSYFLYKAKKIRKT